MPFCASHPTTLGSEGLEVTVTKGVTTVILPFQQLLGRWMSEGTQQEEKRIPRRYR